MKHVIKIKPYTYECGDGCCDEYGHEWYVDGEFVHRSPCDDNGWLAVLSHLKVQAEVVWQDEDGDDVCSL